MNRAEVRRLPPSVGALVDVAAAGFADRAGLYVLLASGVFALCAAVQFLWPGHPDDVTRLIALQLLELFADAFVVATIALGVGARLAEESMPTRALLGAAVERWLPVLGALTIVQFVVAITLPAGAIGPIEDPVLAVLSAPVTWLLWGAMSLAGPIAALNGDRPALAVLSGFGQALQLSLRAVNLARLCLIAFASVVPLLLQNVLVDVLRRHGIPNADFWAWIPIDQLAIGPLTALQTVFALDFARRRAGVAGRR